MRKLANLIRFIIPLAMCMLKVYTYVMIGKRLNTFKVNDCLKGSFYYYRVHRSSGFYYDLEMINQGMYLTYKKQVVNKAFKRIDCDKVPTNANITN